MTLQIEFWQLVGFGAGLLSGFAGIIFGAGRLIAAQFELRINERFDVLQKAREAEAAGITNLERDFLRFRPIFPCTMCAARTMCAANPSWKPSWTAWQPWSATRSFAHP